MYCDTLQYMFMNIILAFHLRLVPFLSRLTSHRTQIWIYIPDVLREKRGYLLVDPQLHSLIWVMASSRTFDMTAWYNNWYPNQWETRQLYRKDLNFRPGGDSVIVGDMNTLLNEAYNNYVRAKFLLGAGRVTLCNMLFNFYFDTGTSPQFFADRIIRQITYLGWCFTMTVRSIRIWTELAGLSRQKSTKSSWSQADPYKWRCRMIPTAHGNFGLPGSKPAMLGVRGAGGLVQIRNSNDVPSADMSSTVPAFARKKLGATPRILTRKYAALFKVWMEWQSHRDLCLRNLA